MSLAQPKTCLVETTDILTAPQLQAVMVTYCQRKHTSRSPIPLKQEKIMKDSSVRVFISPSRQKHIPHQWREKSNEIVISTNVDDQRMSLSFPLMFFFNTFWFLLSTIISFLVFPPSICHLWRWRNDTKTSNHIFYVITFHLIISSSIFSSPLRTVRRETFLICFLNWYG